MTLKEALVLLAGELTVAIRVQDHRRSMRALLTCPAI
jgi:hypothetical protein